MKISSAILILALVGLTACKEEAKTTEPAAAVIEAPAAVEATPNEVAPAEAAPATQEPASAE